MFIVVFLTLQEIAFLQRKNAPRGCALRRTMQMSQATAAGARMCQGTFFVLVNCRIIEKIYCIITTDMIILTRLDKTNTSYMHNTS